METIFWQTLNKNNFNIFMRDLSQNSINLKHMLEDLDNSKKKKNNNNEKKKKMKKKDIIIQEQIKKKEQKLIDDDYKKIDFFINNLDYDDPYINFEKLKTDDVRTEYKFRLLEIYWKKKSKYLTHVLNLYFHLKYSKNVELSEKRNKIMTKIDKILEDYDYKFYMFEQLGHLLPPLNFWDKNKFQFEEWQIEVLNKIKKKESILVKAPTSSGKTFLATSCGIYHKKVLYICPAKPIAYQVGSNFIKMGYKVHFMIEGHAHQTFSTDTNIYVGIPETIEKYIYKIGINFDYAVYDEIHNLNKEYENVINLLDCNFLALSATIKNTDYLKNKIKNNKEIHYVEYNKRFINQQRFIWNSGNLEKIHPCICLDVLNFDNFNISFTPNDCAKLYEKISEEFEDHKLEEYIDNLSPDNYFKEDKLLTLDDSKEYEIILKKELKKIYIKYPDKINKILSNFEIKYSDSEGTNYISLFKKCKKKDLFPMILFHTKEEYAIEIFENLYKELREKENFDYPFHYEILRIKNKYYSEYLEKRKTFESSIKIKTKDAYTEKNDKMNDFEKNEKENYISNVIKLYYKCIEKCKGTLNEKRKISNLNKELEQFINYPDFRSQDIYKKHPNYCFTNVDPMSGDEIKSIRREIYKATSNKIDYESSLFQLLKRGIGIYIESNPDEYNWIIQKLMVQKKLGIIISDRTLCLGIDLPIRSVCFTGYKDPEFTKEDYMQMSGRAGRRGKDNQGNIIFHNISNYKELMMGELPEIRFKEEELNNNYFSLKSLNNTIDFKKLNIEGDHGVYNIPKLSWYLNKYNSYKFVNELNNTEIELFKLNIRDRDLYLFKKIIKEIYDNNDIEIINNYKNNLIKKDYINIFIEIGEICKNICNSIKSIKYKLIYNSSKDIFNNIKHLVNTI